MSGSDSVTLTIGSARIEVPAREIVQSILGQLITPTVELKTVGQRTPPRIGAEWPGQGGIYAGISRGEEGQPDYHLIVPTHASASFSDVKWGAAGKEISGANSERDGMANTEAMAKAGSKLAREIRALEIDGHSGFMLPARRDLSLCFANVPELFESAWYWSSTQYSAYDAWCQYFGVGSQYAYDKDDQLRARAVRRFLVIQ